jgi:sterol O-acyltransferase
MEQLKISSNSDKIKKQDFREKNFLYRESTLSVLFDNDINLKSLYYLIVNLFIWLLLWVMIGDIKASGRMIHIEFWLETFKGLDKTIMLWVFMFLYSFLIVPYVKFIEFSAKRNGKINYFLFFIIYLAYQLILYQLVFAFSNRSELQVPCRLIISCEMIRFSLKIHAYFREKLLYGLKKYHLDYCLFSPSRIKNTEESVPDIKIDSIEDEFKKYLYFSFCPSLIFRDKYPRLTRYRYNLILAHFSNFIFCILFYYILMRYICEPYFNYSKLKDYYSFSYFCFDSLRCAIPGMCFLVVGHFLLLHSWLNLWSEILRHGDRRFYEDWWNCTNFEEYYRKWNMVVHEWLYYYVYNDVLRLSLGKLSRMQAKFSVFILSVFVHELIVWISLGFFFPILSIFFGGPGIIFTFIKPTQKNFNIVFWCKLFLGKGLILVLYLREFKMRIILDELGLVEAGHEWIPRTILMFFDTYKNTIIQSKFY